ncbi:ABC transporter ATP-binding protein [Clostridium folliculivorans]|uniref:ABC transporter ATP-binding protein n=1 Tax=Clostridium folliculivorans TaxID=2886038 RepID=A0A9W5XZR7_9CLOT|nr:ABC transporter ATP-binding protein [Clostridium folliculivorans]GKU24084.1 ABC transporter ATP-binding protein [Clostridium folliculivorans]GKU30190.1 ABC transporter ATP-binding protein [Clostridium folliculivorans]
MLVEVKNIDKTYRNKKKALNQVSFNLDFGKIVGIIGPNGSGKTTLINCMLGNLKYDNGVITWHENLKSNKKFFFIPDENILPELLTGKEYLEFLMKLYGKTTKDKIDLLLDIYDMQEASTQLIGSYSYGMKKKIQIIGAYLLEPQLLVLDEPFRGLDVEAIITTKELLRKFIKLDATILLSSHDMLSSEQVCDQIIMLSEGKKVVDGNPKKVIEENEVSNLEELFIKINGKRVLNDV